VSVREGFIAVTVDTLFAGRVQTIRLAVWTMPFAMVGRATYAPNWTRDPFGRLIVAEPMAEAPGEQRPDDCPA
jgi:hypothetical protein